MATMSGNANIIVAGASRPLLAYGSTGVRSGAAANARADSAISMRRMWWSVIIEASRVPVFRLPRSPYRDHIAYEFQELVKRFFALSGL